MKKRILMPVFLLALTGCLTTTGNYRLRAVDEKGMELSKNLSMTAAGSGIYSVRNALCATYPGATVLIEDTQTGKPLESESPYQCKRRNP